MLAQSPRVQHSPPPGGFPGLGLAQAMRKGACHNRSLVMVRDMERERSAAPASRRTLMNEKGRLDAISLARWDVLNRRCVFFIRYSVNN
jgi:hypothetical protein